MKKIEGLYTNIAAIINERRVAGYPVLDAKSIVKEVRNRVDVRGASRRWLENAVIRLAVNVELYQHGYRSVLKGKGYFVDPEACNKPEILVEQFKNAAMAKEAKDEAFRVMVNLLRAKGYIDSGQTYINLETMEVVAGMTEADLLAMLKTESKLDD